MDAIAELRRKLERIEARARPHVDDSDDDRVRLLEHVASLTKEALALIPAIEEALAGRDRMNALRIQVREKSVWLEGEGFGVDLLAIARERGPVTRSKMIAAIQAHYDAHAPSSSED